MIIDVGRILWEYVFPNYLWLAVRRRLSVADFLKFTNGVLLLDVNFIRAMQDWELMPLSNFMDTIYVASVRGSGDNKMHWEPDKRRFLG